MDRSIGVFALVLVIFVSLSTLSYVVFELGNFNSATSYLSNTFFIEEKKAEMKESSAVYLEKDIHGSEGAVHRVEIKRKESFVSKIIDVVNKILEFPSNLPFYNSVQDDYYSSEICVSAGEQSMGYSSANFFYAPAIAEEKFAVYSPQLGVIDSKRMEVVHNFTKTASNDFSNPLGADTYGILRNSQLQMKRRLIMDPGETDNFRFIYTITNIGGPFLRDKTKLSDFSIKNTLLAPSFADLDGDGDLDMLVGEQYGKVFYFENAGNADNPDFRPVNNAVNSSFSNVKVHYYRSNMWSYMASPSFADLDGDGDYDLILGNKQEYLGYYENVGNRNVPVWQEGSMFYFLNRTYVSDAAFADLDDDGDLDMVIANSTNIVLYENIGDRTNAVWDFWSSYNLIPNKRYTSVEIVDIDGDNDYDILVGGDISNLNGQIHLIENIGSISSPSFRYNNNFTIDHGDMLGYDDLHASENYGFGMGDLDGDGDHDLVFGNENGTLTYYERDSGKVLNDLYFYEIPLIDFIDTAYNGSIYYDYSTDSFTVEWTKTGYPKSSIMIYSDMQSVKHGIESVKWYYPSMWRYGNGCTSQRYDNSEDMYWTDGELNNMDNYAVYGASGEIYTCSMIDYNTSWKKSPVLGFYIGDLGVGESKDIEITYKYSVGSGSRRNPDLSVEDIRFIGGNVSFDVANSGVSAETYVRLAEVEDGEIVKDKDIFVSVKEGNKTEVNTLFDVKAGNNLVVVADPDNLVKEDDENNNIAEKTRRKYNVYVEVDMGGLNNVFEEFAYSKLSDYNIVPEANADYKIFVGGERFNNESLQDGWGMQGYAKWYSKKGFYPYNGFVNKIDDKIIVRGVNVDGVVAALKYVDWNSLERSKHYVDADDVKGLEVFDFFRLDENKPYIYTDTDEFRAIVHDALFGRYVEENLSVRTLQGVELRLRKVGSRESDLLREYKGLSNHSVILAGGLWSDIDAWKELGQELADNGRDVYLAEITGGPKTECDVCNDYTYQEIVDYHVPAIVGGVIQYSGSNNVQWVGHSNGGRSGLDFISAHSSGMSPAGQYWDGDSYEFDSFGANAVSTYVGVGVPGAFAADSPFSRCMKAHGEEMLSNISADQYHLSQKELGRRLLLQWPTDPYCLVIAKGLNSNNKISMKLTKQYYNWINSSSDVQPGAGVSVDKAKIIYGTRDWTTITDSDLVVPVADDIAIYNNINAVDKYLNESAVMHHEMNDHPKVKDMIIDVIN